MPRKLASKLFCLDQEFQVQSAVPFGHFLCQSFIPYLKTQSFPGSGGNPNLASEGFPISNTVLWDYSELLTPYRPSSPGLLILAAVSLLFHPCHLLSCELFLITNPTVMTNTAWAA